MKAIIRTGRLADFRYYVLSNGVGYGMLKCRMVRVKRIVNGYICVLPATVLLSFCVHGTAHSAPVVEEDIEAFLGFEEGQGAVSEDITGNGHVGTLVGCTWGDGYVSCAGNNRLVEVTTGPDLQARSFTYDLWFEAYGSTGAYGRILTQAQREGGEGVDIMEFYGRVANRVTRPGDAVFQTPTIGALTNPAPPDHTGYCEVGFHREDGPEHLVYIHDEATRTVRMFLGMEGQPLNLCFEAVYDGSYTVEDGPIGLGNHHDFEYVENNFPSNIYQFAYYSRPLTYGVDGGNVVVGGELLQNHQAGATADAPDDNMGMDTGDESTSDGSTSDGSTSDGSSSGGWTGDGDSTDGGDASGGGSTTSGGTNDGGGNPQWPWPNARSEDDGCACSANAVERGDGWWLMLLPLFGLRRRRDRCG